jgi:hypothetical protein
MQSLRFIQQARDPQTDAAHFYSGPPKLLFRNQTFAKSDLANKGNQESRLRLAARRSLHAGSVPNEVRWKNLLRHLEFCCLPEIHFPDLRMLELAKGFEPPTLGLQNRCSTD